MAEDFTAEVPVPKVKTAIYAVRGRANGVLSQRQCYWANIPSGLGGAVLRFNTVTREFVDIFVTNNTTNNPTNYLNRPEGLVFGPDGNLYITSFQANANDNDKILVFNGTTGAFLAKIDLAQVGQPRAFAMALLFGPGGYLYVPISGDGPHNTTGRGTPL